MQLFLIRQNISNFEKMLASSTDPKVHKTVTSLLASFRRELALHNASRFRETELNLAEITRIEQLFPGFEQSPHPMLMLHPGPNLPIVDINGAYARATMTRREEVRGRPLFEVFPDNPTDPNADGVLNLFESIRIATAQRSPHAMAVQRYDIRDLEGRFVVRYWQPINSPLFDESDQLIFILHHVEDVTHLISRDAGPVQG